MSKDLNLAVLLDLYGSLLTEKQFDALDLYYNQDFSLAEIAENADISRQGVRDAIKRGEHQLLAFEEKLGLAKIYRSIDKLSELIDELDGTSAAHDTAEQMRAILEDLRA